MKKLIEYSKGFPMRYELTLTREQRWDKVATILAPAVLKIINEKRIEDAKKLSKEE